MSWICFMKPLAGNPRWGWERWGAKHGSIYTPWCEIGIRWGKS